uniref:Glutathione-regulated potassium-efflux system protein KefB n=1 Tax=Candidatus Methanogaster sp. ANME-2c ERB4 TaxID=2759911 RepID=A0A7G9YR54_9EURY|nr:glutathione-regulated potassium-efflux system protein KefB [Methanosarcinales archaeon ANME-2c ERB4]
MHALLALILILFLAKVFGELSERAGFPSILGEIGAGIVFGLLFLRPDNEALLFLSELGAIFLLFTAGYKEINLRELKTASKMALIPTISQVLLAFGFGFLIGWIFDFSQMASLFMGVAFSMTSIGMSVRTLIDLNYLSTKIGSTMLASAILDDLIGIFMLSVMISIASNQQIPAGMELLVIAAKIIGFIAVMAVLGRGVFPVLFTYIHRMRVKESIFAFVIMIALFSAYLAEAFGLHAVIGAFVGGACLSSVPLAKIEDVQSKVSGIAYGIFIPIFFAFIGLSVDPAAIQAAGLFALLVIVMALAGKLIGGFIGSRIAGFDSYDSLIFGVGVMPRAGIELVVISAGRSLGIIGDEIFSAIVLMVAVSVIVSPVLLKFAIKMKETRTAPEPTNTQPR